ncbi:MFS transporter [Streptomyces longwoodensis]|uniref:MFS transporter n=1 Tax=Streptomyces longwoodensis TaxID=68231 RepID=UPI003401930F
MTSASDLPRTETRARLAVALGLVVLCIEGYDLFILGAVGPSLLSFPDWHATSSTLGLLGSVTALGMPLGSIGAGWAGDLYGRRLPMLVALAWLSLAMLLSAAAGSLAVFTATRFATGIGLGALIPLVTAYVSEAATPARRSTQVGIALTGVAVGGIVSGLVAQALLPEWDFRTLFLFGVVPLVLLPVVWRTVPTGGTDRPVAGDAAQPGPVQDGELPSTNRLARLLAPAYRRATLLYWTATFTGLVIVYGAGTWLPTLMVKAGYDVSSSLEFSMAFNTGAVVGIIGAGLIADRGFLKSATVVSFLLAAVAMIVLSTPQPRPVLLLASAIAGHGALGTQSLINLIVARGYPAHLRGTGLGFSLGVGRLGAIVGPSYLSAVTVLITWQKAGFYAFVVPALLGAAVTALLRTTRRAHDTQPTAKSAAGAVG